MVTANPYLSAIQAELTRAVDAVPEGWFTCRDLHRDTGKSIATCNREVRALLDSGQLECRDFRIQTGRRVIPVPHYRKK